ncbi:MAG: hypothetical protein J7501_15065, partial [Bdellovibrio sp.]|nr:hypothetical protein [Bdellovibrio sp.]
MSILSTMMLFLTIASSVACQRSETRQNSPTQPIYLGNLDKKMAEIYDDKNKSYQNVCDIQWRPKILEISRVLEKNRAAIEAMAEDQTNAKPQKTLEFGVFKFLDDTSTPVGKDEWSENIISW